MSSAPRFFRKLRELFRRSRELYCRHAVIRPDGRGDMRCVRCGKDFMG